MYEALQDIAGRVQIIGQRLGQNPDADDQMMLAHNLKKALQDLEICTRVQRIAENR
jgi:hypothetical protein